MELLYREEHLECFNYDREDHSSVRFIELGSDRPLTLDIVEPAILIMINGEIRISFEKIQNGLMIKNEIVLLPPCSRVSIFARQCSDILVFKLGPDLKLCDRYSLEKLYDDAGENIHNFDNRLNTITANERINNFVDNFMTYFEEGLKCVYFLDIKLQELFFIFRAYYPKEKLAAFFSPLLTADTKFLNFILSNYRKVHSIKEFAQLAGYSLSGFDKQFRKVFGMSAFQWVKQKRLKSIFHEINCSHKTFKEICEIHGFSSLSQFNDYCKKNFGLPPGKIRRKMSCALQPESNMEIA